MPVMCSAVEVSDRQDPSRNSSACGLLHRLLARLLRTDVATLAAAPGNPYLDDMSQRSPSPLAARLERIAREFGIRDVYAFGSRAQEIMRRLAADGGDHAGLESSSDVDVAVQPYDAAAFTARDRTRLTGALEDLFGAKRVDLVILSEAPVLLATEVVRGELLYSADPLAQAEHELYVLRRAGDLAPFLRERVEQILTHGAR